MKQLFKLGEAPTRIQSIFLSIIGFIFIVGLWEWIVRIGGISNTIFPSPSKVVVSMYELLINYNLLENTWYSIKLNFLGYFEAIAISIPLGFLIGLFPFFN